MAKEIIIKEIIIKMWHLVIRGAGGHGDLSRLLGGDGA